jgi:homopolymeric O-antigen transport system ATP-binding protein
VLSVAAAAVAPNGKRGPEVVLAVDGLSKKFCRSLKRSLFYGVQDVMTEAVGAQRQSRTLRTGEFWALRDVSFQVSRGEAIGLVGPNGAGKSTLLRIVSGLIKPDTGVVRVRGKVAPLIALGAGFNPILTGRENVYANMSILGLSKKEIDNRFDEVIDFAETDDDALDAPVQTYSSGMAARLGFACAIYTAPDILLIDEVLSVGDIKFRMKCNRRLAALRDAGTCFVLVSHNPHSILSICDSALYLSNGVLLAVGETQAVMDRYEQDLFAVRGESSTKPLFLQEKAEGESEGVDIVYVCFKDEWGQIVESPLTGSTVSLSVGCKARTEFENINVIVAVSAAAENERVLYLSSQYDNQTMTVPAGNSEIQIQLPHCGLKPGVYSAKIVISQSSLYMLDVLESFRFRVKSGINMNQNLFYQPRSWKVTNCQTPPA